MLYDAIHLLQLRVMEDVVDPTRLAAMGYCFGGGGVIQLLHAYPNNTDGLLGEVLLRSSGTTNETCHLALHMCQGFSASCPHCSILDAGVVGFHSSLPTMFTQPLELNNPVRALFFNGYNDPGAPPQEVDSFLVCFVASCQLPQSSLKVSVHALPIRLKMAMLAIDLGASISFSDSARQLLCRPA